MSNETEQAPLTVRDLVEKLVKTDMEATVTAVFKNSDPFVVIEVDQDEESGEVVLSAQ